MKCLRENIDIDTILEIGTYATTAAANAEVSEVDVGDAQNVLLYVRASVVGEETTPVTVTLQGSNTSGGSFADLTGTDGNDATVTLTAAGAGQVEVRAEELKRYLKVNVEELDDVGDADTFCAFVVSGNYQTLPISQTIIDEILRGQGLTLSSLQFERK